MNVEIKITHRQVCLISEIEKVSAKLEGTLDKFAETSFLKRISKENLGNALELDQSSEGLDTQAVQNELETLISSSKQTILDLSSQNTYPIFSQIVNLDNLRDEKMKFFSLGRGGVLAELVFETYAPYLIETRYKEINAWHKLELETKQIHPLLVIASHHLLFLQCSPFKRLNHCLSLSYLLKLLKDNSYGVLAASKLVSVIKEDSENYFLALRRAEKTTGTDFSTLNVWLEFFLEKARDSLAQLKEEFSKRDERQHLSELQKNIIEVIKTEGPINREALASELGINPSTAKYNLGILHEKGHLERRGGGRSTKYSVNL